MRKKLNVRFSCQENKPSLQLETMDIYESKKKVEEILFENIKDGFSLTKLGEDLYIPSNYTVCCFFDNEKLSSIIEFIEKLKTIDERQLFYNPEQLHVTLLGQIDESSSKDQIIDVVQSFLDKNIINFYLFGVGSSNKVSSITAYPVSFPIEELRKELRKLGGGTVFDGPYEQLAWINIMRFIEKPKGKLLEELKGAVNTEFGVIRPKSILLLKNSSRLLENAEIIRTFDI